ncbi:MAG: hypothetical protein ACLGHY_08395, partial [Gammaproteobacteria bacterium]
AFHRAHQAWYTHGAGDAAEWGIAAFAGRSGGLADALTPQDALEANQLWKEAAEHRRSNARRF